MCIKRLKTALQNLSKMMKAGHVWCPTIDSFVALFHIHVFRSDTDTTAQFADLTPVDRCVGGTRATVFES